ncbi:D-alanyl-D-alanine carboxypeptidase family protein [Spiribacter salinus]|jgi:D-alanyl-D-alanine carboxypeptidase (penicillin-binding protein 5/6)|nr:D-alanyl-D-alanine carboxypeptidase family protein [Spiribacter salinus]MBY5269116.1 serine-type D-Ala-D-Ala carboxypeptidase [Spiribacter salinus]
MPRTLPLALSALLILCLSPAVMAQTQPIPVPSPPSVGANGYVLLDFHTNKVLAERNSDTRLDPASLTKVMTAFVVFSELKAGNLQLTDPVQISENAWRAKGSRMFIEVGSQISVENLLRGMIVQSGNDASIALAEHIAGSEQTFAALMNQYADELGMANTQYTNAAGLPEDDHYSTAADTARLVRALINRFPEYYGYYSERSFVWNDIEQFNRNRMLWQDDSVDGVKTGYTESAGYCLATSAERDGMRLISVVMGTDSAAARVQASKSLLNFGYRFYETRRLYAADDVIEETRVWKGEREQLPLGLADALHITVPSRAYDRVEASLEVDQPIQAPIEAGTVLGRLTISLDGESLASRDVVALEPVTQAGLVGRLVDSVKLWLN